jgi:hypothetical protein
MWQVLQVFDERMCDAFLPVAVIPLWQVEQLAVTAE